MPLLTCCVNRDFRRSLRLSTEVLVWSGYKSLHSIEGVPKIDPEELALANDFRRRMGDLIGKTRLDKDISQERLAEAAGVSLATLSRWERAINAPKSYQLGKLWKALDCPPDWLLDPPDSMSDLDRRLASKVEEGRAAAYRPRRRATRVVVEPAVQPAPRRGPGRRGSPR